MADWAEARLVRKDGTFEWLDGTKNCQAVLGRLENNLTLRSGLYQKIRLGDRQFERGLNVQANSIIKAPLKGEYARFEAWVDVDAWAGTNGTVRFSLLGARSAARKQLFECRALASGGQKNFGFLLETTSSTVNLGTASAGSITARPASRLRRPRGFQEY